MQIAYCMTKNRAGFATDARFDILSSFACYLIFTIVIFAVRVERTLDFSFYFFGVFNKQLFFIIVRLEECAKIKIIKKLTFVARNPSS